MIGKVLWALLVAYLLSIVGSFLVTWYNIRNSFNIIPPVSYSPLRPDGSVIKTKREKAWKKPVD